MVSSSVVLPQHQRVATLWFCKCDGLLSGPGVGVLDGTVFSLVETVLTYRRYNIALCVERGHLSYRPGSYSNQLTWTTIQSTGMLKTVNMFKCRIIVTNYLSNIIYPFPSYRYHTDVDCTCLRWGRYGFICWSMGGSSVTRVYTYITEL